MLVSFSDSQMQSIFAGATAQVPYADRARYLCLIGDALASTIPRSAMVAWRAVRMRSARLGATRRRRD